MTKKKYLDYPGLQSYNNALKGVYATKDLATSENNGLMSSTDKNKLNNLNVVEMTQAEYNALSTAEKNNGTIYFITDAGGTGGGGASSESIAPIEQSTTASQAYEIGDLFFLDDVLYKVTTAIASGGTIVVEGVNANVVQTDVDSELKNKQNDLGLLIKNGKLCVRYTVEE